MGWNYQLVLYSFVVSRSNLRNPQRIRNLSVPDARNASELEKLGDFSGRSGGLLGTSVDGIDYHSM